MKLIYLLVFFIIIDSYAQEVFKLKASKIKKIEFYQEYSGKTIKLRDQFKREFLKEFKKATKTDSTAYLKTYKIFIHHKKGKIDTLFTNGYVHQSKRGVITKENLIEKYIPEHDRSLSNRTQGVLKTFRKLQFFLKEEQYNEVINCFSFEIQWYLKEIKKNDSRFKQWCLAWTLEDNVYHKYVMDIKQRKGKGSFVFEENEWKIDQK